MFQGTNNVFLTTKTLFSLLMDKGIGVHSMPSFLLKADFYSTTRMFYLFGFLRNIVNIRSKGFF